MTVVKVFSTLPSGEWNETYLKKNKCTVHCRKLCASISWRWWMVPRWMIGTVAGRVNPQGFAEMTPLSHPNPDLTLFVTLTPTQILTQHYPGQVFFSIIAHCRHATRCIKLCVTITISGIINSSLNRIMSISVCTGIGCMYWS